MNPVLKNVTKLRSLLNPAKKNGLRWFSKGPPKFQNLAEEATVGSLNVATFTDLPEEHQMLKDVCRQFAETELWPIAGNIIRSIKNDEFLELNINNLFKLDLIKNYTLSCFF